MKNKQIPVNQNEEYELSIGNMGFQGEGVARIDNYAIFVPGAIAGENVKAIITRCEKKYGFAKLTNVIKPSPSRKVPKCPVYSQCGGCNLQHMSYRMQLEYKKDRVIECLSRIAKIDGVIIHNTIGMDEPFGYRNKVQLPVGVSDKGKGSVAIGFYAPGSHHIIDTDVCYIQDETADEVVRILRNWMKKYNIEPYNEATGEGTIRHIMIRNGFKTKEVMVVLVSKKDKVPHVEEFVETIKTTITGIKSIVLNINGRKTNTILGQKNITLWGNDYICDYIDKFKFNISPLSFFQINPVQTEKLYAKALEYADLSSNDIVFDAYCGTGSISLFLSQKAKKVYGVELVPEAIEDAKKNAKQNNIKNAEFIVGKSEEEIPKLIEKGIIPDVVVVDPPRKGCDAALLNSIAEASPKKIVYVSCDPATLSRDLGILTNLNYKVMEVQPVDMFPMTSHVECVVLMSRVEK
ncbi:23S rRNA m(5)U-1939 methyltransferase [Hathewaya proteolytica DSM 3090]|uniref:23S rRNA m(5)U-1939 methyltransferase n=1 Tax=Hathewaya proteolytica DSM 3090 TaxID=1121331 RepID=A0A1M6NHE0_9CLOT|nr:23S rRNA (uracil(1939)-C(5))-methyltransferase RlmD [Hathewaya proteolytica]SHJ95043.1 23S rRNA m(5)U-1939 methyltransferase [Hathewaya proteolytica DSM 3090]